MYLNLAHTKLDVFIAADELVLECYNLMEMLPAVEKFNLTSQIKRTAVSVILNIAEGASRKSSVERKRFYEIARSSLVELDTAVGLCVRLNFFKADVTNKVGELVYRCFGMLTKMITKK